MIEQLNSYSEGCTAPKLCEESQNVGPSPSLSQTMQLFYFIDQRMKKFHYGELAGKAVMIQARV
jgi:hypothetical protein